MGKLSAKTGALITAKGLGHKSKGAAALAEYIRKKRDKQIRRNQRKHREEIIETRDEEKQLKKVSDLLWSAHLRDDVSSSRSLPIRIECNLHSSLPFQPATHTRLPRSQDTANEHERVTEALRRYSASCAAAERRRRPAERAEAEAEALRELERELWVPPRVQAVTGLSDDLSALPWDFAPTPGACAATRTRVRTHE